MIGYNEKYFTDNGKVWFPIMGEYEFSRTEKAEWEKGVSIETVAVTVLEI